LGLDLVLLFSCIITKWTNLFGWVLRLFLSLRCHLSLWEFFSLWVITWRKRIFHLQLKTN